MPAPTFRTERLILRAFREADAEALHGILCQEGTLGYFPNPDRPTVSNVRKLVARQISQWEDLGYAWWAVESKITGELLGWNGLQYLPETGETEIAFLLDANHWGRGLTTEAGRVGLEFGFETLALEQIVALAHPENGASRRVIEKLGLRLTGEAVYFGMAVCRYALDAKAYRSAVGDESALQRGPSIS